MPSPISSKAQNNLWIPWIFAVVWNGFSGIAVFQFLRKMHAGTFATKDLLMFLFPLIGLGLLTWAIRQTLRQLRYGEAFFTPDEEAFALGSLARGTLSFSPAHPFSPETLFLVTLSCLEERESGSGNNRSTTQTIVWQDIRSAAVGDDGTSPVSFLLPADGQETALRYRTGGHGVLWKLDVKEKAGGSLPFVADYLLSVVRRELTPEELAVAEAAQTLHRKEIATYQRPSDSPIVIRPDGIDGTEFFFPSGLNRNVGLGLLLFLLAFGGIAFFLSRSDAPFFVALIFGLVAALLAYAALQVFFGSMRTVLSREELMTTRSLFGWTRTRRLPAASITGFKTKVTMTSGSTAYHAIQALQGENAVSVSPALRDSQEAEWLATEMERLVRQ